MVTKLDDSEVKNAIRFWLKEKYGLSIPVSNIYINVNTIDECVNCTFKMEERKEL